MCLYVGLMSSRKNINQERGDCMVIAGLQKMTLLDFPNHVACTVFLQGCNFRCPFCQNKDLVIGDQNLEAITIEKFFEFLKKRKGFIDGVCVTGGEPFIHKDIENFLRRIKELGLQVKLDTNGYFPETLKDLVNKGLVDYVAMDIKNSLEKYGLTTGLTSINVNLIKESVDFLINGKIDYEFRTTIVREFHKKSDFIGISNLIKGAKRYFLQGFVDSPSCIEQGLHAYTKEELEEFVNILKSNDIQAEIRGVE